MAEIGQFTHDIRFIEGKSNICADTLSRPIDVPLGEAYAIPEQIASVQEEVVLETFSPEVIRQQQELCSDVKSHLEGKIPKFVNMGHHEFLGGTSLYCEMSGPKPRPLLPASLRKRVLEAFHGIDHCGQKALLRRVSSEYYWPRQNTQVKDFWANNDVLKEAFKNAKQLLINATTLAHPNPNFKLALTCDASKEGIGGHLEQYNADSKAWEPIGFFSRRLQPSQKRWSTFKRELYAVHQSMRFFTQTSLAGI